MIATRLGHSYVPKTGGVGCSFSGLFSHNPKLPFELNRVCGVVCVDAPVFPMETNHLPAGVDALCVKQYV